MLIGEPTSFTAPSYGLLSTATGLDLTSSHWKMGVVWEDLCPDADGTYDPCIGTIADGDEAVPAPAPPAKAPTFGRTTRGATPFTAYASIQCSPVGSWDQLSEWGRQGLLRAEERYVENVFWTGIAGGQTVVFPHLAADSEVFDGEDLMQPAATVVTTVPQQGYTAIGMLEEAMRDCYPGIATIHMPLRIAGQFVSLNLTESRGGVMYTRSAGSKVVIGDYPGTAPDGTSTPGVTWVYATGPVFYMRDQAVQFRREDSLDRNVNTVTMITERTYVVGFTCCLLAIPIQNGENTA
jgi:hypothetical protein